MNSSLQHLWPFTFPMRVMTFLEYTRNRFYQSDSKCIACSIKCLRPIMSYNKSKSRRIFIFDKTNYKRIHRFCLVNMWTYSFCCFGCNWTNHRAQNIWPKLKSKPYYRDGYLRQDGHRTVKSGQSKLTLGRTNKRNYERGNRSSI